MKFGCAVAILAATAACNGGGNGGAVDAGPNVAPDAEVAIDGGPPDADPLADTDGDGILNGVDLCPTVADPAQVDLDGDGIGWMCDPVESTTIPFTGELAGDTFGLRGNTMGVAISSACVDNVCSRAWLGVGPGGVSRSDGASEAWLTGRASVGFVGAENHVWWSMLDGVLADHDASTSTFTQRLTGVTLRGNGYEVKRYERDQLLVLSAEPHDSSTDTYQLFAPQPNGDVTHVASSSIDFVTPTIVGHDPARLVFGVAEPGNQSLREFVPGSATSQPIVVDGTPLSHADVVRSMSASSPPSGMFGFCVEQDGKRYIVETFGAQLRAYEAPISSCVGGVTQTEDRAASVVMEAEGSFLEVNGAIHPLAMTGLLELHGTGLPAVLTRFTAPTEEVYVVDATGALHPVESDGLVTKVTRQGDTLHFVSIDDQTQTMSLVRYRSGTTTQVPLPALGEGESWQVFTTREGAAFATTSARALVWPSQATEAMQIDFDHMDVLVRANTTLFVASHNDPRSQPALHAYGEVGGVPQYTALTPEVVQNVAFTMTLMPLLYSTPADDDGLPAADWFMYEAPGGCHLVRATGTGAAVTLEGDVSCSGGAAIRGLTAGGTPVVEVSEFSWPTTLYLLSGNTLTKVLDASSVKLLYAAPDSSLLLGWQGRDTGDGTYLCSATHPDRCWSSPGDPLLWSPTDPAQPDAVHVLFGHVIPGAFEVTSIRTFGEQGDRPQPLL